MRATLLALAVALTGPAAASATLAVEPGGSATVTELGTPDGVLAAGDSFDLTQPVKSNEPSLTGVYGRLTTTTPGVTFTRSGSPYPDAAFGATVSNTDPFRVAIGADVPCGTRLDFNLAVEATQGSQNIPFSVGTGLAGPLRHSSAADVPRAIPDMTSIVSSFDVATPGLVKDLRVQIGQLTHDYVGDLRLWIEAPDGTTVLLADGVGGSGDNFSNTTFSQSALPSITGATAPFGGSYRPQGDLSVLDGHQQQGTWKLHVADTVGANTGTLVSWGADIAQAVCSGNPIPSFTATPNPVEPGATATLDASASFDPSIGGSITKYEWDFDGDGTYDETSTTSATTTHAWGSKGVQQVVLRVTDNEVHSETVTVPVYVTLAPTAAVGFTPAAPATGQLVTFDASASTDGDGTIAGYAWDLDGNGSYERSTGATPTTTTTFATPGAHTVRVRVTDDTGAMAVAQTIVTASNRGPAAQLSVPATPVPGQQVTLDASGSSDPDGTVTGYEWDLDGDGFYETSTGPAASTARSFPAAGSYTVRVRVTDDNGATATASATVSVDAPPLPALSVAPSPAVVGAPVAFSAAGSSDPDGSIARYEWDLDGDGSYETDSGTSASVSATYAAEGTRAIRLRVTDDRGISAVATSLLRVDPVPATGGGTADGSGATGGTGDGGSGGTATGAGDSFTAALLGAPIQAMRLARTKGLTLRCRVSAGARCSLTVYLPAAQAVRLRLARRTRVKARPKAIGHVTVLASPARPANARIVLSAPARRALARARTVRVVVRGSAVDGQGRRVALTRVVLLRG